MGYAQIVRRVEAHELTNCDDCGNNELTSSGKYITDSSDQPVIWFCFNCVQKTTREIYRAGVNIGFNRVNSFPDSLPMKGDHNRIR